MTEEYAIKVNNLYKSFRLIHEKRSGVYEFLTSGFSRGSKYEVLEVLKDVSFSLKKGEILGIIGFNGMGKTTLLRILSKIYKPTSGTITINGKMIPFLELGSGFQPEMTARDNIILYGAMLGFTKKQMENRIDEIIHFAELEKFADTKLKHFSSGMYSRLAFSTAIQVDPDILLIDEVLAVGDIGFQQKSLEKYRDFKERGKTIVLVTHNLSDVEKMCDSAILLHHGIVYSSGVPLHVIESYLELAKQKESQNK